ncbi:MAG: hypothetical protein L3J21_05975 [Devosiaceae bacterium]|nr:hypothetical protein [Devosiaceae bacterium]
MSGNLSDPLSSPHISSNEFDTPGFKRRDFLYIATGTVGVVAVTGSIWPLIEPGARMKVT